MGPLTTIAAPRAVARLCAHTDDDEIAALIAVDAEEIAHDHRDGCPREPQCGCETDGYGPCGQDCGCNEFGHVLAALLRNHAEERAADPISAAYVDPDPLADLRANLDPTETGMRRLLDEYPDDDGLRRMVNADRNLVNGLCWQGYTDEMDPHCPPDRIIAFQRDLRRRAEDTYGGRAAFLRGLADVLADFLADGLAQEVERTLRRL